MNNGYQVRTLDYGDEYALGREGRQGAIDWFELEIERIKARAGRETEPYTDMMLNMPLDVAITILECAKRGMHKGQGRRGMRKSYLRRLQEDAVLSFALKRKAQLRAEGRPATGHNSAEDQAAEEAKKFGHDWYGLSLSASTIKRWMQQFEAWSRPIAEDAVNNTEQYAGTRNGVCQHASEQQRRHHRRRSRL